MIRISSWVRPLITCNNCYNSTLINAYINGSNVGTSPTTVLGTVGIEFEGPAQGFQVTGLNALGFDYNISTDSTAHGSPIQLQVSDSLFDFCAIDCIALNAGQEFQIARSNFTGESNSPFSIAGNAGIRGGSSFTTGPNIFTGNTLNNFGGSGSIAETFAGTLTYTSISGDQFDGNTSNLSATAGTGSVIGANCAAGISASTGTSVYGIVGHC